MRICYPLGDKVVFDYLAVSIRDYDHSGRADAFISSGQAKHEFYREWARVFTGYGKGRYICFFAEHIESLEIKQAFLGDQHFFLVKVRFRRCMFFRRGDEKFGIRVDSKEDLGPFQKWLLANEIKAQWELNA